MSRAKKNIVGYGAVERALKNVSKAGAKEIAAAINKGGAEIKDRAKQLSTSSRVTRALHVRPIRTSGSGRSFGVRVGVFYDTHGRTAMIARYIEFGTAPRQAGQFYRQRSGARRRAKGTHPGTQPKPFMFPAYWSLRKRIRGRITRAVNKAIKDSFRGR